MKLLIIAGLLCFGIAANAQKEIKIEDIRNYVGDSVKLMAEVYSGKYFETTANTPTYLNVGGSYPNPPLTLVIWGDVRKQFKNAPETFYPGRKEWIAGKVELYKNKPQIVIHNADQIYDIVAAPIGK
jgi:hypothetical protein